MAIFKYRGKKLKLRQVLAHDLPTSTGPLANRKDLGSDEVIIKVFTVLTAGV